jgi:DNA-binding FadR family transcriptional regulator
MTAAQQLIAQFDPVPRRKLAQSVLDQLLESIQSGALQAGSRLPSERQLMAMFGVGRPAVREALQSLERMGLVSITHGERAQVVAPTVRDVFAQIGELTDHLLTTVPGNLAHLKEARVFFETGMVRKAATLATKEDIAALRQTLDAQRAALDDLSHFLEADMAFHVAITHVVGNPIYVALSEAFFGWLSKFYVDLVRLPGGEQLAITEHTAVFEAIAAHDPDAAAAAMEAHLLRANQLYAKLTRVRR